MIVKNNSNVDIIEYPIGTGFYTLKAGEAADLPEEAALHLKRIYGFVGDTDKSAVAKVVTVPKEEVSEEAPIEDSDESVDYNSVAYRELQKMYSEKTGEKAIGKKKAELVEILSNL